MPRRARRSPARRPGGRHRGFALVEALAAVVLAAVAGAGLAAAAAAAAFHVGLQRERATALALAAGRLDALRAGPRASDADAIVAAAVRFDRRWTHVDGRGLPDDETVRVAWRGRALVLRTRVWP